MIPELRNEAYENRLVRCKLITLEMRRHRNDLIEIFKILHGYEGLKKKDFFIMNESERTRGHTFKIFKERSRLNITKVLIYSKNYRWME